MTLIWENHPICIEWLKSKSIDIEYLIMIDIPNIQLIIKKYFHKNKHSGTLLIKKYASVDIAKDRAQEYENKKCFYDAKLGIQFNDPSKRGGKLD
jgi:hypothetical protein